MPYEIKWTSPAKDDYVQTLSYVYDTWGEASADKFTEELIFSLKNLEQHTFIGRQHDRLSSVRQLVLKKRHILCYTVFDDVVLILNILNANTQL